MRLDHIDIEGFGSYSTRRVISFSDDGATVVLGRNEAGKSTLLTAITAVLFGFKDPAARQRHRPWQDHEAYAATLVLKTEGGQALHVRRDFETDQVRVVERDGDAEIVRFEGLADPLGRDASSAHYQDFLKETLGFRDEAVFRQTVYFEQQSLETGISDQVRRLLSGSSTMDYRAVQHELHRRYAELTNENPWRSHDRARSRRDSLDLRDQEERLQKARASMARSVELEAEIAGLDEEVIRLNDELATADRELDAHERLLPLLERQASISRRLDEITENRDRREAHAQRVREIESRIKLRFSHLVRAPNNLGELIKGWRDAMREADRTQETVAKLQGKLSGLTPRWNRTAGLAVGGLLFAVCVAVGAITTAGIQLGAFALAIPMGALGWTLGRRIGASVEDERRALDGKLRSAKAEQQGHAKRATDLLGQCGPAVVGRAPEEVLSEFAAYIEIRDERKTLLASMQALGEKKVLDARFDEVTRERAKVETGIEELYTAFPELPPPDAVRTLETRISELRQSREHLGLRTRETQRHLDEARLESVALAGHIDVNLAELADGVRESRQKIGELDLEREALKFAIDTLEACVTDFQELDLEDLEEEVSRIFREITGERYGKVELTTTLDPKVRFSEGSELVDPRDLSQGARDQLYFAMRVALGKHLSEDIRLPLLLDDPFVNFDRERRDLAKGILDALPDHQVVLMTCHDDYRDWTDDLVQLDASASDSA